MPITEAMTSELFLIAKMYQFPNIHQRLMQIGESNLTKYMTPERYTKVKNAMKFNDPGKAIKALALLPNDDSNTEPSTDNQAYAIFRIAGQWFMPKEINSLVFEKDLNKLTKRQASTVIDRLKKIEKATQDAEDIDTAANPLDVQTVTILLNQLPKAETV
jgi:hypothetical protein